jgi:hypothetical protein
MLHAVYEVDDRRVSRRAALIGAEDKLNLAIVLAEVPANRIARAIQSPDRELLGLS